MKDPRHQNYQGSINILSFTMMNVKNIFAAVFRFREAASRRGPI